MRIDSDTEAFAVGPVELNVSMARKIGWSDDEINAAAESLAAISRGISWRMSMREGKHRRCTICEVMTFEDKPCHNCGEAPKQGA